MTPNQIAVLKKLQTKQQTKKAVDIVQPDSESDSGSSEVGAKPAEASDVEEESDLLEVKEFLDTLERNVRRTSCRLTLRKLIAAGVDKAVKESQVQPISY